MDTDLQRIAEQPRLTPARETWGVKRETWRKSEWNGPLPSSRFTFHASRFIVSTAVFRFNQRNPLFPGTQLRIVFKSLLTWGIRCQELRSQSGTKPCNLRNGKVGVCQEVWSLPSTSPGCILHSAFCLEAGGGAATQILLAVYHQRGTSCLPPALLQCLHVH